jgi:hypothetical protein
LDGEAGENHRKAVWSQKNKKTVIYSEEEDQGNEEHTGPANSINFIAFQEPSSSNYLPLSKLNAAVGDHPIEIEPAAGNHPIEVEVNAGLTDVPTDEIPVDKDIGSSNSEFRVLATDSLGINGMPAEALELEVPPVAANVEKRSTRIRKGIQMNGCECGEEVTNENREGSALRCNTRGCETCRHSFDLDLDAYLRFSFIGGVWIKSTMI